jgi:hypothetical protein
MVQLLWRFSNRAAGATSAVEPSDLSEPSGLAPSVSIKQTTAPTATASPFRFQCDNPTASAGNSRVALSESTSAIAWSFYIISVFYQPSCISTSVIDSPGDGTFISKIILYNFKL